MMDSTYIFRPAKIEDAQTIKNIARRIITSSYTSFLGAEVIWDFIESGLSDKEIDDGMENCILMTRNDKIIGFSITRFHRPSGKLYIRFTKPFPHTLTYNEILT